MTFDSPEWRAKRDELLNEWLLGNQDAIDFLRTVFSAAELWDDVVDGDHAKAADSIDRVMLATLLDLPFNDFFDTHKYILRGVMLTGVNAWMDSHALEQENDAWSRTWAYALRDFYMELVPLCAMIVGGFSHMRAISLPARRFFQAESLEEYLGGMPEAERVELYLENAKGERLEATTVGPAKNGRMEVRFMARDRQEPFDLRGAHVVALVPGVGRFSMGLGRISVYALHEGEEFVTSWELT